MTRASVLLVLLLLACEGPSAKTAQLQCEAAADKDPTVQAAIQEYSASVTHMNSYKEDVSGVRKQAVYRCLRARGLVPRGGVEAVKPPS
jgi:hypothetical protein